MSKYDDSTVGVGYGEERKGARKRAARAGVKNAHGQPLIAELARGAAGKRAISTVTRMPDNEPDPFLRPLTQAEKDLRELLDFDDD